ncbi:hypothetical protein [Actinophytocola sp. NPDC049390]|uniref:hypothetical protein n=1 Tax=Actinophytocola sp. NPDC049390 TaxID=3363894 RepID=UPI003788F153
MGEWFQTIADVDATPDEAAGLADEVVAWLVAEGIVLGGRTHCLLGAEDLGYPPGPRCARAADDVDVPFPVGDGLDVRIGRTVFHGGQSGVDRVSCPHCGASAEWDEVSDTIGTWFESGVGGHSCRACGRTAGLNDWGWDPPWAFGYLGFTFWNWPPLGSGFVADVASRLGHRVVVVADKL